eukprot:CAMPEP_0169470376 /NCGR_PEP_ID=MMETSP1042-20121227/24013_1 /TAXON_ID=464988 /ORGANISM="Hemiselmis andersenii, Strain CCMP1180" /LENGTH=52 /DNA_ID=CAMNT_0009583981 /DNA_START=57 /DNA_END=212 /DNA_ORIENTATION=-
MPSRESPLSDKCVDSHSAEGLASLRLVGETLLPALVAPPWSTDPVGEGAPVY